ncbi:hypothetical protein M9194_20435 [Vibrio sp. S4M6]|uniref:hypothetical protein n=1 Tax=Vibrio sinus TaxID=2946865 RepID=UPI002029DED6|nr:hypothetical protein [Vibrio sinus]MCL9783797.1 hypothetical protein [Vibrio sinus]
MENLRKPLLMPKVKQEVHVEYEQRDYGSDKKLVMNYIAEINGDLKEGDRIKVVMSLPGLLQGDPGLKSTKDIIHDYASAIQKFKTKGPDIDGKKEKLQQKVQKHVEDAITTANDGLGGIKEARIKDASISKEFASDTYDERLPYRVGETTVKEKTEVFTRGVTSKDAKKLRGTDVHGHFLGNPMLRKVQAEGGQEVMFARMGALSKGQGDLFGRGVNKIQSDRHVGHLDLRLVDPKKERTLYETHKIEIGEANKVSETEIKTCTLPVNSNDMSKTEMLGRGLKVAFNKHPVLMSTVGIIGGLIAAALSPITIPATALFLNSKQNKFKDEWNEAQKDIKDTLEQLNNKVGKNEKAQELYKRTMELYEKIYNGKDGKATKAANGFDGLMLGVLMMKLANEVGMTTSEGCKSNKDRGTMLDFMIQAQEAKWAANPKLGMTKESLLNLSNENDRQILREVVSQSDTRNTGERNTGLKGNMYFCRDIGNVLGDQYNSFVGDSLKGSA